MISAEVALPLRKNERCSRQPASAPDNTQMQKKADGRLISATAVMAAGSAPGAMWRRRGGKVGERDALVDGEADRGDHREHDRDQHGRGCAAAFAGSAAMKEMECCTRAHPRSPRNDRCRLSTAGRFLPGSASAARGIRVSAA